MSGTVTLHSEKQDFTKTGDLLSKLFDVIIVGAGASGIGCALALQKAGVYDVLILERGTVGESFRRWPRETRFISPSFIGNQFGAVDLNAISPETSPGFSTGHEHMSGVEYADYLLRISDYYDLNIQTGVEVTSVNKNEDFQIETTTGKMQSQFVIWAGGESQYPNTQQFPGAELCLHYIHVSSWESLEGNDFIIIGGYESGIDAAVNLAKLGKNCIVLDRDDRWEGTGSDPSTILSIYTQERFKEAMKSGKIILQGGRTVTEVTRNATTGEYKIITNNANGIVTKSIPILANGFHGSTRFIDHLFSQKGESAILLSEDDESTITPGIFLSGPMVRHEKNIFCFIYKFRQRFAVIAGTIGTRLGRDISGLDFYRHHNMYLDDLSCCGTECSC